MILSVSGILTKWRLLPQSIFLLLLALVLVGLVVIYDAAGGLVQAAIFKKQLVYAILFFVSMLVVSLLNVRLFFNNAYIF